MQEIITKIAENLRKNNMETFIVDKKEDIIPLIKTLLPSGASVGVGGSASLNEIDFIPFLRNGDYKFFDRHKEGLSREEALQVMTDALSADVFFTSSNAITEDGALYNVDGNGNRIAALCFGPKKVIVVAGANKIVKDLKEAEIRVKKIAAPKNCVRLGMETYCAKAGECVSLKKENPAMYDGCQSSCRICDSYLITGFQRNSDRIKVIICKESMGY